MKIDGVSTTRDITYGPLVFRRGPDKFLAFTAKPCWDLDEFNQLCPYPETRYFVFTKGGKQPDNEHPSFKEEVDRYIMKRWGYVVFKTLEPSKIEFENVDLSKPDTLLNVVPELKKALSIYEWKLLSGLIDEANALDAAKLEENQKSFFQLLEARTAPTGQSGEAESSKFSALANVSA